MSSGARGHGYCYFRHLPCLVAIALMLVGQLLNGQTNLLTNLLTNGGQTHHPAAAPGHSLLPATIPIP
jgi:hypothetical protein